MKSKRDAIRQANEEKHNSIIEEVGPELEKFENKMYNSSANRQKAIKDQVDSAAKINASNLAQYVQSMEKRREMELQRIRDFELDEKAKNKKIKNIYKGLK